MISKSDKELLGKLDYIIPEITELLFDEILGRIEEEKEILNLNKKGLELKKNKAQDCLFLIGKVIDFKNVKGLLD